MEIILKKLFELFKTEELDVCNTEKAATEIIEWCDVKLKDEMKKEEGERNWEIIKKIILLSENYKKYKEEFKNAVEIILRSSNKDEKDYLNKFMITVDFSNERTRYFLDDLTNDSIGKQRISLEELIPRIELLNPYQNMNLNSEEEMTLGYFLMGNELYNNQNGFYYTLDLGKESDWNENHDRLLKAIYTKDSVLLPLDVIKALIAKNLLYLEPNHSWTSNRKNFHSVPSKVVVKQGQINQISPSQVERLKNEIAEWFSQLIQKTAENDNIMMALFLREIKKLKTEEVDKIIGEEYKELDFTMGSGVEHSRIHFNPNDDRFNKIDQRLKLESLDLIKRIEARKREIDSEI